MELFSKKEQCCGCMACSDVCPQNAILMEPDSEGFLYPHIQHDRCTNCKHCKGVCPMRCKETGNQPRRYLGVQAKDQALRRVSTSGAVFPVLAAAVLGKGGVVYGAGFDDAMRVVHQRVDDSAHLSRIMQTKYVQSETVGIIRSVQQDVFSGKQVLFAGTPCQAEALRRYMQKEYPNLLVMDLICYGVPSPGVWAQYVKYLEETHHGKLLEFQFRDKRGHDNGHTVSFKIGCREYIEKYEDNPFTFAYSLGCMLRPSCHVCPFAKVERNSDLTIGDFWGIEDSAPQMDDGMGTSLVMLRSERGMKWWQWVQNQYRVIECGRKEVLQPRLVSPTFPSLWRRLFFMAYRKLPFSLIIKALSSNTVRRLWHVGRKT